MNMELVDRSLTDETRAVFEDRIREQAARLRDEYRAGELESPSFAIGIELELYAIDDAYRVTQIPSSVFGPYCDKELGKHNAEIQTTPDRLDDVGLRRQLAGLETRFGKLDRAARDAGIRIVPDAMWSVPASPDTMTYLTTTTTIDGVEVPTNMTPSERYFAIDRDIVARTGGHVTIDVPGATVAVPTILVESLTSSIQPHLQIPRTAEFARYHNLAVRTLGPVLALATNSPLLPIDLYEDIDPLALIDQTHHELRIAVFEQSINDAWEKVRFPIDIEDPEATIDELLTDPTCAPFLREWIDGDGPRESFAARYWEFDHKRGTYWRWLRAVIGGQPVGEGDEWSIRLEYRPIPTQPTIRDNVGILALVAGLLRGLHDADHPLTELPWETARSNFYTAVTEGLDGEQTWITETGAETTDQTVMYDEIHTLATRGLAREGVEPATITRLLDPIMARWDQRMTPSIWKLEAIRRSLAAGDSFQVAVDRMQIAYLDHCDTDRPFAQWPAPEH